MEKRLHGVAPGLVVQAREHRWRVARVEPFRDCTVVTLHGHDEQTVGRRTTLIMPFDRLTAHAVPAPARCNRRNTWHCIAAAVARAQPGRGLWCAADGSFDVHPWQLAAALAVVAGATRVLLADAVGLGKTIQAGLILSELWRRGLLTRALVLTPPALREAWVAELRDRFRLEVAVMDQQALQQWQRTGAAGLNPWLSVPIVVSSIDLVKRAEIRLAVEDEPLDLLVVDEAHHATPGSDRAAVVSRLAERVAWLVLASATPHSGDARAYASLMDMGATASRDRPMVMLRRSHRDAGLDGHRATHVLPVSPTAAERRLQEAVLDYGRAMCLGTLGHRPGVQLVASVLARRSTSTAFSSARTLQRRLDALSSRPPDPPPQPALPWEELEPDDTGGGEEARWIGVPGLADTGDELARLRWLVGLAHEATAGPSKIRRLLRLLARLAEPAIVFSEFRDSIEACLPQVERVASAVVLHGGLDAGERGRQLRRFLDGRAHVLLATDVAGEGLNLQARARVVITLEWPWSPQRLEQRIGRVDRIGQARRVHAFHLTASGTFESSVLARLLERRARAETALGGDAAAVAAEIFGLENTRTMAPGRQTDESASAPAEHAPVEGPERLEAGRVIVARRLHVLAGSQTISSAWCLPRRPGLAHALLVVVEVRARSPQGRQEWCDVVGLRVDLCAAPPNKRHWARLCRRISHDRRIHHAACSAARAGACSADWSPAIERLQSLRRLRASARRPGLQTSLFDRRATLLAESREAVLRRLDEHARHHMRLLSPAGNDVIVDSHVVGVLPLEQEGTR